MNSKLGIFTSTVLMLIGIALWSVTVLADEQATARHEAATDARLGADAAHREAAANAVQRMRAANKADLDIAFVDRTSTPVAGD